MKKEKKDESFLKQPYYVGGDSALKEFISKNLVYPKQAMEHNIEGSIPMTYDINYKGEVADVRLMHHLGFGCDEEAVRLVKLLHFTVPKLPRNLRVIFHKKLTIHFRLPKHPEKALESQGYNISYIQKPIQKKMENTPVPSVYTYTINYDN